MEQRPVVGIGVMIFKDGKVLLAERKGSHGEGEFATPGGHLEFGESFEACAIRETQEETGIEITNIRFQYLSNIKKYGNKHYVHIGLNAEWKAGEPVNMEPSKSGEWKWFSLDELPKAIFESCRLALEAHQTHRNYYDS